MNNNPTLKDLRQFKITLLLLPVIPAIILYFKHHYTVTACLLCIFWGILALTILPRLVGKNADRPIYLACKKILEILGTIIAGIALVFTWIFAIFPTAVIAKITKRDRLVLKKQNTESYWKEAKKSEPTYENQY